MRRSLHGAELPQHGLISLRMSLIHRPDNDYNPNAISVSMPADIGQTPEDRHLGYLYDHHLRKLGMTALASLAELSGGEIRCTGFYQGGNLELALPHPKRLAAAIDAFLPDRKPHDRIHTSKSPQTTDALSRLNSFESPRSQVRQIRLALGTSRRGETRSISLADVDTGRSLGQIADTYVLLNDERDRDNVLNLLAATEVPVAQSITQPAIALHPEWPVAAIPNIWTYRLLDALAFRARNVEKPYSHETMAIYNPETKKLWVEDSRLVGPCLCYASRVGIEISAVGLPRKPWHLEDEIPFYELKSNRRRNQLDEAASVDDSDAEWTLLKSVRRLIPPDLYAPGLVRWSATPYPRLTEPSVDIHERYVTERQTLFGNHSVARSVGRCRLCGELGLAFSTPACVDALCYCQGCLIRATRGAAEDRQRAAAALGLIGRLEFDQSPMLESQLDHLHINPAEPVSGEFIDTLLLLRFAIRRNLFP
ncbi:hypothetical protein [Flexivirga meconopsidis]|uniref:hypothetical protein n=1 Tax=Flexivirga meconopsidis TaxID=2977121 RepID=UPI00223F9E4F|nr:hypothetical protein [Flexivirga meconopsidis]